VVELELFLSEFLVELLCGLVGGGVFKRVWIRGRMLFCKKFFEVFDLVGILFKEGIFWVFIDDRFILDKFGP
jgi:hypothetical protein